MKPKVMSIFLIWIIMAVIPFFMNDYLLHIGIMVLMYAYLSQSWNIMSGYSGQFSFGHALFFGVGAYVSSILFTKFGVTPWIGMLIGGIVALLIGLLIGFLSFRYKLKGAYFALATLAFAEMVRVIIQNLDFFNKTMGVIIPLKVNALTYQFADKRTYFYVIFIMVSIITYIVYRIDRSKLGFSLIAIRENEDAARSLGVEVFKNKMIAVGLSSFLAALAGTFYAQYMLIIEPTSAFASHVSIAILLPTILGGAGTVFGPLVGALIVTTLGELTTSYFNAVPGLQFIIYGLVIIIVIMFLPEGVVGWLRKQKFGWKKEG
jgi:branched-chain amino acid transport system permease protein